MTVYEVFYAYADHEPQRIAVFLNEEQAQQYIRQAAILTNTRTVLRRGTAPEPLRGWPTLKHYPPHAWADDDHGGIAYHYRVFNIDGELAEGGAEHLAMLIARLGAES